LTKAKKKKKKIVIGTYILLKQLFKQEKKWSRLDSGNWELLASLDQCGLLLLGSHEWGSLQELGRESYFG